MYSFLFNSFSRRINRFLTLLTAVYRHKLYKVMTQYILRERVVSDDVLTLSDKGRVFKGGYIAIVEYNTFQNAWQDKKHIKRFRSPNSVHKFLKANYDEEEVCDLDFSDSNL